MNYNTHTDEYVFADGSRLPRMLLRIAVARGTGADLSDLTRIMQPWFSGRYPYLGIGRTLYYPAAWRTRGGYLAQPDRHPLAE